MTVRSDDTGDWRERLQRCASAEDFFTLLDMPFEPAVLNVARLHILKRMGEYLQESGLESTPDDEVPARCRQALQRAYADFLASTPLQQRVFSVLKRAAAPKARPFVPLAALVHEESDGVS